MDLVLICLLVLFVGSEYSTSSPEGISTFTTSHRPNITEFWFTSPFPTSMLGSTVYSPNPSKNGNINMIGPNVERLWSVTNKGITCKDWMNDTEGTFDDSDFPFDGSIANASNYCRDPRDMRVLPWCMIDDPNLPWNYCNYPICNVRDAPYSGVLVNKNGELSTEGPEYFLPTKSLWTLAAPPGHKLVFKILVLRTNIGRCEAKLDAFTNASQGITYVGTVGNWDGPGGPNVKGERESHVVYVSFKTNCPGWFTETGFKIKYEFIKTELAPVHDVLSTDQYESTTTLESSSYYSTTDLTTLEVDNGTPEVNNGTPEVNNGTPKPTFNVLMICQLCVCILVCLYFITQ